MESTPPAAAEAAAEVTADLAAAADEAVSATTAAEEAVSDTATAAVEAAPSMSDAIRDVDSTAAIVNATEHSTADASDQLTDDVAGALEQAEQQADNATVTPADDAADALVQSADPAAAPLIDPITATADRLIATLTTTTNAVPAASPLATSGIEPTLRQRPASATSHGSNELDSVLGAPRAAVSVLASGAQHPRQIDNGANAPHATGQHQLVMPFQNRTPAATSGSQRSTRAEDQELTTASHPALDQLEVGAPLTDRVSTGTVQPSRDGARSAHEAGQATPEPGNALSGTLQTSSATGSLSSPSPSTEVTMRAAWAALMQARRSQPRGIVLPNLAPPG